MTRLAACALAGMLLALPARCTQKWRIQYFYDQEDSSLVINDLQFLSSSHGVAVGYLDEKGKSKPVSVSTTDGGGHWAIARLHDLPISIFFLNDHLGWMVTPKDIWQTRDGAATWRKIRHSPDKLIQVYFVDEQHGFAVGAHKAAYQTQDGGQTWQRIAAAAEPDTKPEHTAYNCIAFINARNGVITGFSEPPEASRPEWLEPEEASRRREAPHITITLDTHDGGKTWSPSTSSVFGHITRALFLPDGRGLGLMQFTGTFQWTSEVLRLDALTGKSTSVYQAKDREITDVLLLPSGTAYLAGVEVVGRLPHSPIPQKLEILKGEDFSHWQDMEVDYRANATRALLRAAPGGTVWAATDTGMILKLSE
jgi:Photosynthesis system II assembly factor YCF48